MKLNEIIFLVLVFFLSLGLRCYKLDNPVADWHSWRQADTAAVARNFIKQGFNFLYPQSQKNPSIHYNPQRYFLNEFPLYNAGVALLYKIFGVKESYARLLSAIISSLTAVFLYMLIKNFSSKLIAGLATFFWAVLPYNIYYGRVIMPDPAFILFSVSSLYFISLWVEKEKLGWAIASGLILALALLEKPYAIFLGLPIAYLVWRKWEWSVFTRIDIFLVLLLAFIPFGLWRYHINQHPEGMFGSDWLYNASDIRFKGAFFRWIIFDRMNRLIFATGGFVLFWLGLITNRVKKEGWFFILWLISVFSYICIFAMGNVTHDYYQMPLVPISCLMMAKGVDFLLHWGQNLLSRVLNIGIAAGLILLTLAFGWYEVRGYYNINRWEIVEAGKMVDKLVPADALVIAPYNNDPAFLYQTNRNGWAELIDKKEFEQFVREGATHYVSVDFDSFTQDLMKKCKVMVQQEKYVIIDLQNCV